MRLLTELPVKIRLSPAKDKGTILTGFRLLFLRVKVSELSIITYSKSTLHSPLSDGNEWNRALTAMALRQLDLAINFQLYSGYENSCVHS